MSIVFLVKVALDRRKKEKSDPRYKDFLQLRSSALVYKKDGPPIQPDIMVQRDSFAPRNISQIMEKIQQDRQRLRMGRGQQLSSSPPRQNPNLKNPQNSVTAKRSQLQKNKTRGTVPPENQLGSPNTEHR